MSLSGSRPRRLLDRLTAATTFGPRAGAEPVRSPARALRRDLKLWEAELADTRPPAGEVSHPPIEQVATHLRRLRAVLDELPDDVSFIRWEAVLRAYDDFLWVACRELQVPTDLITIGFGRGRDEERARLERLLTAAGLSVR